MTHHTHLPVGNCAERLVVWDHTFPQEVLRECVETWPEDSWQGWYTYTGVQAGKRCSRVNIPIPPACGELLYLMSKLDLQSHFREWLVPDLGLWGAGLHEMNPGTELPLHLDADHHPHLGLTRVVSMCLYVGRQWESYWGGELVLGGGEGLERVGVCPGRLVAFDCRGSRHSVAKIVGPNPRRSLALFWYANRHLSPVRSRADFSV